MATKTCKCGNPKEDWQDCCKVCYSKKMNGDKKGVDNKDDLILKQTCLKVAGNVTEKGKTSAEVMTYAKQLYNQFQSWN